MSAVDGALVTLGLSPMAVLVNVNHAENSSQAMHRFELRRVVMPFRAHVVGALASALAACRIAVTNKAQPSHWMQPGQPPAAPRGAIGRAPPGDS